MNGKHDIRIQLPYDEQPEPAGGVKMSRQMKKILHKAAVKNSTCQETPLHFKKVKGVSLFLLKRSLHFRAAKVLTVVKNEK